jgi:hypothetical protein
VNNYAIAQVFAQCGKCDPPIERSGVRAMGVTRRFLDHQKLSFEPS